VGRQREIGHQLRPAIQVVRIVGRLHQALAQIHLFLHISLERVRIYAAGRREDHFFDPRSPGFPEHQPIQEEVGGRACLMQIYVATPSVVRGEMKYRVYAGYGSASDARLAQVGVEKLDLAGSDVSLNILQAPAAEIIDHTEPRASL